MQYPDCWPAEAICAGCGMMLRREAVSEPWVHAGRMPGEAG